MAATISPTEDRNVAAVPRSHLPVWFARAWMLATSLWLLVGLVQLRAANALIQREAELLGRPIADTDHFANLPELATAFDSAGLTHHGVIEWTLILGLFASTGLAIAGTAWLLRARGQLARNVGMLGLWLSNAAVAAANWDTLDLIGWLGN